MAATRNEDMLAIDCYGHSQATGEPSTLGLVERPRWAASRLGSGRSARPSRSAAGDALLALVAFGALAAAGSLVGAGAAHADPVIDYAAEHADTICSAINESPTDATIIDLIFAVEQDSGFNSINSGEAVGAAVDIACPRNLPVLQRTLRDLTR